MHAHCGIYSIEGSRQFDCPTRGGKVYPGVYNFLNPGFPGFLEYLVPVWIKNIEIQVAVCID
jgi:hypothetical protein